MMLGFKLHLCLSQHSSCQMLDRWLYDIDISDLERATALFGCSPKVFTVIYAMYMKILFSFRGCFSHVLSEGPRP